MSIRSDVEHYFEKHSNEKVYLKDLQTLDYSADQLQPAVYWLTRNREGYETIHQGQCWIYKPTVAGEEEYMTILNTTSKGSKILQDSEGTIWIAKKVDD